MQIISGPCFASNVDIENLISLYCRIATKPELEKLRLENTFINLRNQDYHSGIRDLRTITISTHLKGFMLVHQCIASRMRTRPNLKS